MLLITFIRYLSFYISRVDRISSASTIGNNHCTRDAQATELSQSTVTWELLK